MKLWIRVDAATAPLMGELAESLDRSRAEAFGLCVSLWCAAAEHRPNGNVGDLLDGSLERWADWTRKRGLFAREFRRLCIRPDGDLVWWGERVTVHSPPRDDRSRVSPSLRRQVFERDGRRCRYCGRTDDIQIDHVEPVVYGGATELPNLQPLCRPCNKEKGPQAYARTHQERP